MAQLPAFWGHVFGRSLRGLGDSMAAEQRGQMPEGFNLRNHPGSRDSPGGECLRGGGARLASHSRLRTVRKPEPDRHVDGSRSNARFGVVRRCGPETALDALSLGELMYRLSRRITIIELPGSSLPVGGWQPGLAFQKAKVFRERFCDCRRIALANG